MNISMSLGVVELEKKLYLDVKCMAKNLLCAQFLFTYRQILHILSGQGR